MRVLFDIVHPANVLFFYHAIQALKARGDEVLIVSRHKDIACELLDQFGFDHIPVSSAGTGTFKLGMELLQRDLAVWKQARKFRPDIMIGFGGVSISHAGKLLGIPAISFYDTDTATLQNSISFPFLTHLFVPDSFQAKTPKGRTTRFTGMKELSYFHPDNFFVDEAKALKNGWSPDEDNFFIRAVLWRANHDIGKSGWTDDLFIRMIEKLSQRGRVHVSSERALPPELEPLRYKGAKTEVHHLVAKCRLYVGESATMGQEAAYLGTQAIYDGHDIPGATQSMVDAGLLTIPEQKSEQGLFNAIDELLDGNNKAFQQNHRAYMNAHQNLTQTILDALDKYA